MVAPVRYLLLTHWDTEEDLRAWLDSDVSKRVEGLGQVDDTVQVPLRHE